MTDYVKDGILHCGKCGAKKQTVVVINGKTELKAVICDCKQLEISRADELLRKQSRYSEIMGRYREYGLSIKSEHCDKTVLKYLEQFAVMLENGTGLLLWGDVGTGKTASAAYAVNRLQGEYIPCMAANFARLVGIKGVPNLQSLDLVVFDDLGAERQSEFMLEGVYQLINDRVNSGKPMILTTNLSLAEMENCAEIKYKRLYDRILSVCVPVRFKGDSHRKAQAAERLKRAKELMR